MVCGLAVLLSIDVIAMGLRRPPLVALPLLVTLSIPVSILNGPIALPVYVGTALLFLRLVATENLDALPRLGSRDNGRTPAGARDALVDLDRGCRRLAPGRAAHPRRRPPRRDPGRRGSRRGRERLPPHVGQPVHPAAARPRGEDTHPDGVRRDRGAVDVVPPHHRARPVHRRRVAPLAPRPAERQPGRRRLPQPAGSGSRCGRGSEDTWSFEFAPNFSSTVAPAALPDPRAGDRWLLALRRAHPRRGLRRRRAAAEPGVQRHLVHAFGHREAAGCFERAGARPRSRRR